MNLIHSGIVKYYQNDNKTFADKAIVITKGSMTCADKID
jgi:hypothetical protein